MRLCKLCRYNTDVSTKPSEWQHKTWRQTFASVSTMKTMFVTTTKPIKRCASDGRTDAAEKWIGAYLWPLAPWSKRTWSLGDKRQKLCGEFVPRRQKTKALLRRPKTKALWLILLRHNRMGDSIALWSNRMPHLSLISRYTMALTFQFRGEVSNSYRYMAFYILVKCMSKGIRWYSEELILRVTKNQRSRHSSLSVSSAFGVVPCA